MKKLIGFIVAIVIIVGGLVILQNVNFNRVGAEQYYTQITGEGTMLKDKDDNGKTYVSYEYKLPAFDKDGKAKILTFTAQKQLRKNAYLTLFEKADKGVTSYQEVKKGDIPKKANEKLVK